MWAYEGNEGYVPSLKKPGHVAIHRVWKNDQHTYTTSKEERDLLVAAGGFLDGVAGYVSVKDRVKYRRLFWLEHPQTGDTIFTIESAQRTRMRREGYTDRGVAGYVSEIPRTGYQPFYRAYDPVRQDHLYAIDVALIDEYGPTKTNLQLERLFRKDLAQRFMPRRTRIYFGDEEYYCPSERVTNSVVARSKIHRRTYIEETFDCDDFAHLLKAAFIDSIYDSGERSLPYAMGIAWGYKPEHHAMNIVVLSDGNQYDIRIIEPQEGTLIRPKASVLDDIYLILL